MSNATLSQKGHNMKIGQCVVWTFIIGAAITFSFPAFSQDAEMQQALKALDEALPGRLMHNPYNLQWESRGPNQKIKVINAKGTPTGKALSAKISKKSNKPWDIVVSTEIEDGVKSGETVKTFFWARTKKPRKGIDTADVVLFVGRNNEPYDNIISEDIKPGAEWQLMSATGTAKSDFKTGSLKAEFQLGRAAQTVEFGPIYVTNLSTP